MKQLLALSLILLSPAVAFSQSSGEPAKKPAEKTAKAPAKKTETTSRTQLQSATNQVAAGIRAADVALTPAELAKMVPPDSLNNDLRRLMTRTYTSFKTGL